MGVREMSLGGARPVSLATGIGPVGFRILFELESLVLGPAVMPAHAPSTLGNAHPSPNATISAKVLKSTPLTEANQ